MNGVVTRTTLRFTVQTLRPYLTLTSASRTTPHLTSPHHHHHRRTMSMKAVVIHEAGGPEVLKLEQRPIPTPAADEVLIRVKAFGLNRSEMFTRQGHSPNVRFPRVLGIEAVGVVEACPSGQFQPGDRVASAMAGMGRDFDGGYAEYTCPKAANTQLLTAAAALDWAVVGAAPEMLQTAYGSLFKALKLQASDRLLVRGGTTSVGLAAAAIASNHGCFVAGTTRSSSPATAELMRKSGVREVIVDDGNVAAQVTKGGTQFDKVLELVGTTTLKDSLKCAVQGGIVCMTGIVGNSWSFAEFAPMDVIPHCVCLTVYSGGPDEFMETPLNELLKQIEAGSLPVQIGRVFKIDQIVEAHETMEKNLARGKIVVLTE
ncbi:hypothetical protein PV04_10803 [Phialophora macrospora]|uniref:Enoyl reductase (ER) domain-containing protein n=1 Tax=Phialophora macrospora TaxID=1851006 RepID=A0A0D2CC64_9EURO|nr:hypothetical protein PV04_10803 [Phialophora macrospora]